jgi:hypothetical protein
MGSRDASHEAQWAIASRTSTQSEWEETSMGGLFNIVMRIFSTLLGLVIMFMGLVWMGQGLHIGPAAIMKGFMVSDKRWALYGAILALLGLGQVIWSNTRQKG